MEKMKMESVSITEKNIEMIEKAFPNCITETIGNDGVEKKIVNFELLKQMLSDSLSDEDETYEFAWVGKKAAIVEANKAIKKTLRPCLEDSVDWDVTQNLYIEGDNLNVLKLLQESYLGKVKVIYIDPPYNTGHDFIYPDSFIMDNESYNQGIGYYDEQGNVNYTRENSSSAGKYHSDWCSMMYSRLMLARNLLTDDGVIFISIDDNEQVNLAKICDEVFGSENSIGPIIQNKQNAKNDTIDVQKNHEYILIYRKRKNVIGSTTKATLEKKSISFKDAYKEGNRYYYLNDPITTRGEGGTLNARPNLGYSVYYNPITTDKIAISDYDVDLARKSNDFDLLYHDNEEYIKKGYVPIRPPKVRGKLGCWTWALEKFNTDKDQIVITGKPGAYAVRKRTFVDSESIEVINGKEQYAAVSMTNSRSIVDYSTNDGTNVLTNVMEKNGIFNNPKNLELIKYLLGLVQDKNCIIMDFFAGSSTTAHAVMELNASDRGKRQFIMVQVNEPCADKSIAKEDGFLNICEIGKERIRRAGRKIKKEMSRDDLDTGFRVFKLDESNMNEVYYSSGDYTQGMLHMLESNIKSDRSGLDLLFGCLLEWGLPLSLPYSSETIDGITIHNYNDGDLIACFEESISETIIKEIAKKQPLRAVFRDGCFKDSPSKINLSEIFKLISPDTSIKVL